MTLHVREYATLTTDTDQETSMDAGVVSQATFNWLLELHQHWSGEAKLLSVEGRQRLKLGSYVGYLQSPAGEAIEILPKTEAAAPIVPDVLRSLLQTMLRASPDLHRREAEQATLRAEKQPVHEWIMGEFLRELTELVRRGLRFDYQIVEEECRFVRGQLDMNRQLRQTPDKAARFHVRYAEFNPQRRENRLLRCALDAVFKLTTNNDHWRLANTLRQQLMNIEPHPQPIRELPHWDNGKQLQSYRNIKPWCRLVLESLNPHFQKGALQGIALLFPMEKLFENYLGKCLQTQLHADRSIKAQASSMYLLSHQAAGSNSQSHWFRLMPDFLITLDGRNHTVLDAKWKLLDSTLNTSEHKYNIKQADLYQMFAYGQRYLSGQGDLVLIYPKHNDFQHPLPLFSFSDELRLWAVPFDLQMGSLIHGNYFDSFS